MFKKFIQRIAAAKDQAEAWDKVFYGEGGIDWAFQHEKISWKDYDLLCQIIRKLK